ncbi:cobalamin biosynthesis protein CbiX [Microbacterium mangrovi]|uniref:Cobalamin biosynthesis protein CbiX n=1 Tax=Microbacterium mangrovi TaxID=1348253 RepID=A0A0B1ZXG0_9MICO|nr:CbiX/SirB N-terminal domain-containing protein [Microbacterium mangrovi]KHK95900.1 cobalamin biosynthesis protein CbiX [Microbacterium mangrovi]
MPQPAFIAISHGTSSDEGRLAVSRLFDAVADRLPGVEVYLGHVDVQEPDVATTLEAAEGPAVIVPLLLSAGYHVRVDLQRAIRDRDDVVIAAAMGPDARLAEVLAERLGPLEPEQRVVLAVAGSSDERANDDCRAAAKLLADVLGRDVTVGFLAAAEPRLDAAVAEAARDGDVVVANYLLAPGYFHDLAVELAAGHRVADPLLLPDDAPPASLVELVVDRYEAAASA